MYQHFGEQHLGWGVTTRSQVKGRWESDPATTSLKDCLVSGYENDAELVGLQNSLVAEVGLWRRGEAVYVPASLWKEALSLCHDAKSAGHFGFVKT